MNAWKRVIRFSGVVVGFAVRRRRMTVTVVVALLLVVPLALTRDGEVFVLNAVGLGIAALVVRRLTRFGRSEAAWRSVVESDEPARAVVRHTREAGMASRSLASQAQVGAHGGRGAGAHARAPSAVSHGSKVNSERRENYDDGMTVVMQAIGQWIRRCGPGDSLEELVDRLFEALFAEEKEPAKPSAARSIHEAQAASGRRATVDGALSGALRRNGHGEGLSRTRLGGPSRSGNSS